MLHAKNMQLYFQASSTTNQVCTGTAIFSGSQMLLLCHSRGSLLRPGLKILLDLEKEKNNFLLFINTLIVPSENEDDL